MIESTDLSRLEQLSENLQEAKKLSELARRQSQEAELLLKEETKKLHDRIKNGESTGDNLRDWALGSGYPYQEREKKAKMIYDCLREHHDELFFFSSLYDIRYYGYGAIHKDTHLYLGKISSPFLWYDSQESLCLGVEKGTLLYRRVTHFGSSCDVEIPLPADHCSLEIPVFSESNLEIANLIYCFHTQERGLFRSEFGDEYYEYILGVGEETVLSFLHKRKIIASPSQEGLQQMLSETEEKFRERVRTRIERKLKNNAER